MRGQVRGRPEGGVNRGHVSDHSSHCSNKRRVRSASCTDLARMRRSIVSPTWSNVGLSAQHSSAVLRNKIEINCANVSTGRGPVQQTLSETGVIGYVSRTDSFTQTTDRFLRNPSADGDLKVAGQMTTLTSQNDKDAPSAWLQYHLGHIPASTYKKSGTLPRSRANEQALSDGCYSLRTNVKNGLYRAHSNLELRPKTAVSYSGFSRASKVRESRGIKLEDLWWISREIDKRTATVSTVRVPEIGELSLSRTPDVYTKPPPCPNNKADSGRRRSAKQRLLGTKRTENVCSAEYYTLDPDKTPIRGKGFERNRENSATSEPVPLYRTTTLARHGQSAPFCRSISDGASNRSTSLHGLDDSLTDSFPSVASFPNTACVVSSSPKDHNNDQQTDQGDEAKVRAPQTDDVEQPVVSTPQHDTGDSLGDNSDSFERCLPQPNVDEKASNQAVMEPERNDSAGRDHIYTPCSSPLDAIGKVQKANLIWNEHFEMEGQEGEPAQPEKNNSGDASDGNGEVLPNGHCESFHPDDGHRWRQRNGRSVRFSGTNKIHEFEPGEPIEPESLSVPEANDD